MGNGSNKEKLLKISVQRALKGFRQNESDSSIYLHISVIYNENKTSKDSPFSKFSVREIIKGYYYMRCWELIDQIEKDNLYGKDFIHVLRWSSGV